MNIDIDWNVFWISRYWQHHPQVNIEIIQIYTGSAGIYARFQEFTPNFQEFTPDFPEFTPNLDNRFL